MLDISLSGVIWTMINVVVLYLLLKKFLWKPVTAMLDRRRQDIEENTAAAQDQRAQAEQARAQYEEHLAQANEEADALIRQAKERADREYQAVLSRAAADADALAEKTRAQLRTEREQMMAGARSEIAALALALAAKVAGSHAGGENDAAMVDAFLSDTEERK